MGEDQLQAIKNSLEVVTDVLTQCQAEYRIVGSLLIAAYTNTFFRKIGDVDIVLSKNSRDCVFERLGQLGFQFERKRWLIFSWTEAHKPNHLGLTFALVGDFSKTYFRYSILKFVELRFQDEYVRATPYTLAGINFIGIPISSAMAGIKQSFLNPKRKLDKQILEKSGVSPATKTYGNINLYVLGVRVPFLYDCFSFFQNVYGGMRILVGKTYESWG